MRDGASRTWQKLSVRVHVALMVLAPLISQPLPAAADQINFPSLPTQVRQQAPIQFQKRETKLEEIFPRVSFPTTFLQPVPLKGVRIPGLTSRAIECLGQSYFVVIDNTRYSEIAELYKDNRLRGKSNFVTADSIIHPYFAFTNRVLADTVAERIAPDLRALLKSMLECSLSDYKQAEDSEVREDIERNIAFLGVAIKLIDPTYFPPVPVRVSSYIKAELEAIQSGRVAHSLIFDRDEDFSTFVPTGWYNSTAELQNFFRCREWLSRMAYPLEDVTFASDGGAGNNFRRSVLLYRCLDLATVNGKAAFDTWKRINSALLLLGAPIAAWQEKALSPQEYRSVFKAGSSDLKVTLKALSEPFFRTKLMLSIRRQKPVKLGATSIFELDDSGRSAGSVARFRLLPATGDPELPWLSEAARYCPVESESAPAWPLGLLLLHAWGAGQANNVIADNIWKLDPSILKAVPTLDRCVNEKQVGGQCQPVADRRWQILSEYFKPLPESAPAVLRTDLWLTRLLESALAGWVDSHLAIAPRHLSSTAAASERQVETATLSTGSAPGGTASAMHGQADQARPAARPASFHYLEPRTEIFTKIGEDAQKLLDNLSFLGYFPDSYRSRFQDFIRLCQRLKNISEIELKGQTLPATDMKLLGNIDLILDKVVVPLAGALPIGQIKGDPRTAGGGLNLALGRPGMLYVILQHDLKTTLARGAVYTYYEIPGPALSAEHWQRKLEHGLIVPPSWARSFDIVQETTQASR